MTDLELVTKAAHYAANAHRRHRRKDVEATPYIGHLTEVALLLATAGCPATVISAGYLHDTIEDVDVTYEMLRIEFDVAIADLVQSVTDNKDLSRKLRKELQVEHAARATPETAALKMADKISNLRSLAVAPPANWDVERVREYVQWSRRVVAQLPQVNEFLSLNYEEAWSVAARLYL